MTPPSGSEITDLKYFTEITWCARLINKPDITVWQPPARKPTRAPKYNELFVKTLATPEAIPAFLAFYEKQPPSRRIDELKVLVALGEGVTGFPGVAHGGMVTSIFDETIGLIVVLNRERGVVGGRFMTAYLNTAFVRPVRLPGVVLVTVKFVKQQGERKVFLTGTMEDRDGTELARAEALFVKVERGKI